jgi:phage major head subunit gpT-like protein
VIIDARHLDLVYRGFKDVFTAGFNEAPAHADDVAMTVPSATREETYAWLGEFPTLREWVGERQVKNLRAHGFTIVNKTYESTVAVPRNDIDDDRLGVYRPVFAERGQLCRRRKEETVFGLLAAGFDTPCHDGQSGRDTDHPVTGADGAVTTVSNSGGGSGEGWSLLSTGRGLRPVIRQEREAPAFVAKTRPQDDHVFRTDAFLYGVRARSDAGFGLWQLAHGSKQTLDATACAAARAAMMGLSGGGRRPGIVPDTPVVPPSLEEAALQILEAERTAPPISRRARRA